ncbi:LysO family transporter [Francisella philomiragia]|nr:LysO family transporter [Francisella philomiragia]MBK2256098.1 LysO family transporter [Francisella philomiragia]MBK2268756.1 LysO family transporter [Francisella philomiragia]MBK2270769.1 LysO family transporter [Francisella philomiragia]MBK2274549.1 LysO family transporter [Francisella philomiragia]
MLESLILFIFLIIGYYIFNFSQSLKIIKLINLSLDFIVISIIFLLGYNFSIFTNTNTIVLEVIGISLIYITIITVANILGIFIFCKKDPNIKAQFKSDNISEAKENLFITILKASKYLIYLIIGYILGEIININITSFINDIVFVMLLLLMLIIGGLLRFENISLISLFKNKLAMSVVVIVIATSIISAILISYMINIPVKQSIMISSGLGWYSLSVVLNTDFIGEYYGMITFMVDFLREILVIAMVPLLKRYFSVEMVGYAANTAMDFCLPILRNNYGNKVVPLAITIGLTMTIITPILLVLENIIL